MNAPSSRHALGPFVTARPAAVMAAIIWGFVTHQPAVWVGASLAGYAELVWWTARVSASPHRRPDHRIAMVTGLALWLVDPIRVLVGSALFGWWLIGFPVLLVNRQRWDARWARRQAAKARRKATTGTTAGSVLAGAAIGHRPPPPQPPPAPPAPASSPGMVFVTGVMHTSPDGSRTFEPLEQAS